MDVTNHSFLACQPERDKKSEIGFAGEQWLAYHPVRHAGLRPSMLENLKFSRGQYEFKLTPAEAALLNEANGRNTAADALKHRSLARMTPAERNSLGRDFYERMWRHGHLFFSTVPVKLDRESRKAR